MVFSSVIFLTAFFPVFFLLYFLCKKTRSRNALLVAFSIFFYAWGEPVWVLLLLFSGLTDFLHGRVVAKYQGRWQARLSVAVAVTVDVGILALFKYSGFIAENINFLFGLSFPVPQFALPVGISFYTFQSLTYTLDTFRGKIKPQKSLLNYLTYLTMFPQLVAGPIIRYADLEESLTDRPVPKELVSSGITRFACGMAKKVLLANSAGAAATLLLDGNLANLSGTGAWLGLLMFTFQIYFDFSGYSDMAIGMGRMIGFEFKENFNYPYVSQSVTDFWRRWHISLSMFFRDYVYIPLGGNRRMQLRNLAVVWFLTGLWHGASWNFILWGVYYLFFLILEKYALRKVLERIPAVFGHIYTLSVVVVGWALFYFTKLDRLAEFFKACLFRNGVTDPLSGSVFTGRLFLIIILCVAATPLPKRLAERIAGPGKALWQAIPVFSAVMIIVSFALILSQTYNPFLYYQF